VVFDFFGQNGEVRLITTDSVEGMGEHDIRGTSANLLTKRRESGPLAILSASMHVTERANDLPTAFLRVGTAGCVLRPQ
jgi:hypothetical protein